MVDSGPPVPKTISHYRIVRRIGAGAMGQVFEATDRRDRSRVAIKLMWPNLAADPDFRERFAREAHVASLLTSPYVVTVRQFGFEGGWPFIVMDYVDGESLAGVLKHGPLPEEEAIRLAGDIARALEAAHVRQVVHRDIKPENILIARDGRAMVADFGVARDPAGSGTATGAFVGNATYGAPEQARGQADYRSDQYAFGAVLYHMLTGRPPFSGTFYELMRQHEVAPIPAEPLATVAPPLRAIVQRCMSKDPASRFASPGELVVAIGSLRRAVSRPGAIASGSPQPAGASAGGAHLAPPAVSNPGSAPSDGPPLATTRVAVDARSNTPPAPAAASLPGGATGGVRATIDPAIPIAIAGAATVLVAFFAVSASSGYGSETRMVNFIGEADTGGASRLAHAWWTIVPLALAIVATAVMAFRTGERRWLAAATGAAFAIVIFELMGWYGLATRYDGHLALRPITGFSTYKDFREPAFPIMTAGALVAAAPGVLQFSRARRPDPFVVGMFACGLLIVATFFLAPGAVAFDHRWTVAALADDYYTASQANAWWVIPFAAVGIMGAPVAAALGRISVWKAMFIGAAAAAVVVVAEFIGFRGNVFGAPFEWAPITGFVPDQETTFPAFPLMTAAAGMAMAIAIAHAARPGRR